MKFNPTTNKLFTDDNTFIKHLHCPRGVQWDEMRHVNSQHRHCAFCDKNVIDIQRMDDAEVLAIARQDAKACFKLNINANNIQVINHNVE